MLDRKPSLFNLSLILLGSLLLLFIVAPLVRLALATSFPELSQALNDNELWASIWITESAP